MAPPRKQSAWMDALVPRFSLPTTGFAESLLRSRYSEHRLRERGRSHWSLDHVESVTSTEWCNSFLAAPPGLLDTIT